MNISLSAVQLDTSIQCRADINTDTVSEYAQGMADGDQFPPVVVFGSAEKCWLGDGWHRVLAAQQLLFDEIAADLRAGGRADALKYALGANAAHGRRRTNADKRRCVEVALREFPSLSSRAIAELCGVGADMVLAHRPASSDYDNSPAKVTTSDGRQYPARRPTTPEKDLKPAPPGTRPVVLGPPADGLQFARMAIMDLEQIRHDDVERGAAFALVREWLDAR